MKQTVGLLMGIYNEAGRIATCLDHHLPYVDEAVIVIQESDDGTERIVNEYFDGYEIKLVENERVYRKDGKYITVLHYPKMGCSEATLQFGADKLHTGWILYVDADEVFPKEFLSNMHEIVGKTKVDGLWLERDNYFDVQIFNEAVPIEPKSLKIKHPARDRQFRLTRKSMSWFPPQIHVRCRVRGPHGQGTEELVDTLDYHIYHHKSLDEQWIDNKGYKPAVKLVDAMEKTKSGELIQFPKVVTTGKPGALCYANIRDHIPFPIETVFYIFDINQDGTRGRHANKTINEVLICLTGGVTVTLDNGESKQEFALTAPTEGLYIKKMTWAEMDRFLPGTILLCLASGVFESDETLRDYERFLKETNVIK